MNNDIVMKIHKLVYSFTSRLLFNDISFNVKGGIITSIVGANNSGKTTLIRILASEYVTNDMITVGNISLSEKSVSSYKRNVSYINLNYLKFSQTTVYDEIFSALENMKWNDDKKKKAVEKIIIEMDLYDYRLKNPTRLNRNTKLGILLAKALVNSPKVLLLELGGCDLNKGEKDYIFSTLEKYTANGMAVVYETNYSDDILYSNRTIVLHKGGVAIEGATMSVLKKDSLLLKLGIDIPFMVDLSLKLKFYEVIDKIYLNEGDLVKKLWK